MSVVLMVPMGFVARFRVSKNWLNPVVVFYFLWLGEFQIALQDRACLPCRASFYTFPGSMVEEAIWSQSAACFETCG